MSYFNNQFSKYIRFTPTFRYVKKHLFNDKIQIDHIAHRSINVNNHETLKNYYKSSNFIEQKDRYKFNDINVEATWLKSRCFRVFTSYYKGEEKERYFKSFNDYKILQQKNDYLAWTILHGHDINHVAISVNNIEETIEKIRQDSTIKLNNEDNPIEISSDGKLLQASTIADKILYKFSDGELHLVPYAFVEFIERRNGREGFETKNAARIFTSTNQ